MCSSSTLEGDYRSASCPDYFPQGKSPSTNWVSPRVSANVLEKTEISLSLPLGSKPIFLNLFHNLNTEPIPILFNLYFFTSFTIWQSYVPQIWGSHNSIKIMVLWYMTLCSSVDRCRLFGETYCLHHLQQRWRWQVPPKLWSLSTTLNSVTSEDTSVSNM